ncbi:VCBS domain-containing protein [Methylobacterium planeticum]|uniref:Tandem-95 repeat protein n=1 Tax=Methylobacterium planeticum TaxID=2615211 RepID=A0A6N6MT70_9HYPH|nr:VCBS domain-containing protein [Methylobacterium planeticum]KAB1072675.1 tandem-95 repeat protein [Methylobacterium planeticum]
MKRIDEIGPSWFEPGFGFETVREVRASEGGTIRLEDPGLLFHGHYARAGADLVVSHDGQRLVVHDYFSLAHRPKLVAPNGASLSDAAIEGLSGPGATEIYAQAGANPVSDAIAAIGRVQKVGGSASLVRNGVTIAVQVGDLVYKGDVVQTDRGGSLAIAFLDGTLFNLSASARMVLNEMVYKPEGTGNTALFNLVQGSITFVAGQVAKTGDMKVGTPVATMGIRGTAVHVQIDADNGTTRFSVMTEPDGHTGRFEVFDREGSGRLLFTVSDPVQAFLVRPAGPQQVAFETVSKTPVEIQFEAGLVQSIFQTLSEVPRLPVPQGPGGGSSTPPDIVPPDVSPQQGSGPNNSGAPPPGAGEGPPLPGNHGTQPSGPGGLIPSQRPEPPVAPRGAEPDQPNLVLLPQNVAVQQDAALLASNAGQGVLVAAPGSTAVNMRIVAAHAGADAAAEGLPLTDGAIVLPGRYGTLTLHADGTYLYRADRAAALAEGVHGFDAFSYRVEGEGGVAAVATLTVDVAGVNDLPTVAGAVDLGSAPGRTARTITVAELLGGAGDVDGDALAVSGLAIRSGGGTLVDLGGGRFAYEAGARAPGAADPVILAYTVTDGHGGSVAQTARLVLVGGNTPAVMTGTLTGSVQEDGVAVASGSVTLTDPDAGDARFAAPASLAGRYGSFRFDPLTGHWSYALANASPEVQALGAGERVQDRLGIASLDGTAGGDLVVTIEGRNDAPVLDAGQGATLTEAAGRTGSAVTVSLSGSLAFSDPDRHDAHTVAVGAPVIARAGAAVPADLAGALAGALTASVTEQDGAGRVAFAFQIADAALDGLRGGERVSVTYAVTLADGQGGVATRPVTIALVGTNDAPVAEDASVALRAGRPVAGTLVASDVDSGSLSFAAVTGPAHGHLSLGADGAYCYTPEAGFLGTDSFTYRASDGSLDSNLATITLSVTGGAAPVVTSGGHASLNLTAAPSGKPLTSVAASYLTTGNNLVDGLGGGAGFGEAVLPANDDGSTGAIDIRDMFGAQGLNIFDRSYTALYVNNNGNITFDGPLGAFRPSSIGGASTSPIIAPFWADVDTSPGAPDSATPGGHSKGTNLVHIDKDPANGVLTVTWDDVGYFASHTDKLNAFQLQLIDLGHGNFDIVYRYEAVNWTLGDYSNGLHARAGYSAGGETGSYELPQSGSSAAMLALPATPGNTGLPGLYVFEVRNGQVGPGGNLQGTGTIGFSDADPGDVHAVSTGIAPGSLHWLKADGSEAGPLPTGLAARLGDAFSAQVTADAGGTGSATWALSLPKGDLAFLGAGDTLSLVYDVVIRDDTAASAPATVAVSIAGPNDGPDFGGGTQGSTAAGGSVIVTRAARAAPDPDDGAPTYPVAAGTPGHVTLPGLENTAASTHLTEADIDAGRVVSHADAAGTGSASAALTPHDAAGAVALTDVARGETVIAARGAGDAVSVPADAFLFNDLGAFGPSHVGAVAAGGQGRASLDPSGHTVSIVTAADGSTSFSYQALDADHPASNAARVAVETRPGSALIGTVGDDILIPGLNGASVLTGGEGHDVFVFSAMPGAGPTTHRVTDFDPAKDAIDLTGFVLAGSERIEDALHLTPDGAGCYALSVRSEAGFITVAHLDLAGAPAAAISVIWSNHLDHLAIPHPV